MMHSIIEIIFTSSIEKFLSRLYEASITPTDTPFSFVFPTDYKSSREILEFETFIQTCMASSELTSAGWVSLIIRSFLAQEGKIETKDVLSTIGYRVELLEGKLPSLVNCEIATCVEVGTNMTVFPEMYLPAIFEKIRQEIGGIWLTGAPEGAPVISAFANRNGQQDTSEDSGEKAGRAWDDTSYKLESLKAKRKEYTSGGKVNITWTGACQLVGIDPQTAKKHSPELREKWYDPSYQ